MKKPSGGQLWCGKLWQVLARQMLGNPKIYWSCWWRVVHPIIYKVLYIPRGCLGFLPTTGCGFSVFFGGDGLIQTESIISKSQLDTNEDAPRPLNQTITTPTINSSPKRVEQNGIHKKVVRTRQKSTKSTYLHLPLGVFFISAYNTAYTTSLRFLTAPFGRCCWLWSKDDSWEIFTTPSLHFLFGPWHDSCFTSEAVFVGSPNCQTKMSSPPPCWHSMSHPELICRDSYFTA